MRERLPPTRDDPGLGDAGPLSRRRIKAWRGGNDAAPSSFLLKAYSAAVTVSFLLLLASSFVRSSARTSSDGGDGAELRQLRHDVIVADAEASLAASLPNAQPRIYVYDIPARYNAELLDALLKKPHAAKFYNYQMAEVAIHNALLASSLRTMDPERADLFYVPVYVSTQMTGQSHSLTTRERAAELVLNVLAWIRSRHPYWDRHRGVDHIWTFTHDQGACLDIRMERDLETASKRRVLSELRESIFLSSSGMLRSACFDARRDIVIPPVIDAEFLAYEGDRTSGARLAADADAILNTLFAEEKKETEEAGQEQEIFASFRGTLKLEKPGDKWYAVTMLYGPWDEQQSADRETAQASEARVCGASFDTFQEGQCQGSCEVELQRTRVFSNGVRQALTDAFWKGQYSTSFRPSWSRNRTYVVSNKKAATKREFIKELQASRFCLCPLGHATWTVRMFEAIAVGCVPVLIGDDTIYPFEKVYPVESYAVVVPEADVSRLPFLLERITDEEVAAKRAVIQRIWRGFTFDPRLLRVGRSRSRGRGNTRSRSSGSGGDAGAGGDILSASSLSLRRAGSGSSHQYESAQKKKKKKGSEDEGKEESAVDALDNILDELTHAWKTRVRPAVLASGSGARPSRPGPAHSPPEHEPRLKFWSTDDKDEDENSVPRRRGSWHRTGTWPDAQGRFLPRLTPHPPVRNSFATSDITIATQCSEDRWEQLHRLCRSWGGPVSAAILTDDVGRAEARFAASALHATYPLLHVTFVRDTRTEDVLAEMKNAAVARIVSGEGERDRESGSGGGDRDSGGHHPSLVGPREREWGTRGRHRSLALRYPVNKLRNVAISAARTQFVVLLDADFVVGNETRTHLMAARTDIRWHPGPASDFDSDATTGQGESGRVALVIPAFGMKTRGTYAPRYKREVAKMLKAKKIEDFQRKQYPSGHWPTDSRHWMKKSTTMPYEIYYAFGYEPFVMLRRPFPPYDERFQGYGQNKVSHIFELAAAGYRFVVHPLAFAVHTFNESKAYVAKKDWTVGWSCWHGFVAELQKHYGGEAMRHTPCWVHQFIYPRLHHERGLNCVAAPLP